MLIMNQPYILLLENDSHDRELTLEYFGKSEVSIGIEFLTYSNEVIPYLKDAETLPALILLRINAVPQTGLEVLKVIKANAGFRHIPVIILGENTQANLVNECMAAGCSFGY
jgi:CheY-like chemotaxis protein